MNFESIDIRRVANGFVVQVETDEDTKEYVYDSSRKVVKFIREFVEAKTADPAWNKRYFYWNGQQ